MSFAMNSETFVVEKVNYDSMGYPILFGIILLTIVFFYFRAQLIQNGILGEDKALDAFNMLAVLTFFLPIITLSIISVVLLPPEHAYNANVKNLEKVLQEDKPGEYSFYAAGDRWVSNKVIKFEKLESVKEQKINVEREIDSEIYLYRLSFDKNSQPVLTEINSGS